MIDNLKYYIFGALAIAAAIAITGNKAKADLLNFSLPQIEMVKTDSNKKVSSHRYLYSNETDGQK